MHRALPLLSFLNCSYIQNLLSLPYQHLLQLLWYQKLLKRYLEVFKYLEHKSDHDDWGCSRPVGALYLRVHGHILQGFEVWFILQLWDSVWQEVHTNCHHRIHFFSGFMGLPAGHPHALENSLELESVPITLNLFGLCTPSTTRNFKAPCVEFPHHICKQNRTLS
jgi:hypothetical protein